MHHSNWEIILQATALPKKRDHERIVAEISLILYDRLVSTKDKAPCTTTNTAETESFSGENPYAESA